MNRLTLERQQVWLYLTAIVMGLAAGHRWPGAQPLFESLLWPFLIALLYATFVQVPLLHLREAFRDVRFLLSVVIGNFIVLPLVAWGLVHFLPAEPALRLGVLLVLLVPCTDWFITFSQLGGGNVTRAIAVTPINLLLQLLLLPLYLWWMLGDEFVSVVTRAKAWPALLVIVIPLAVAALSERWIEARAERNRWRDYFGWWPVPLLALVVFLIAAAQINAVQRAFDLLFVVAPLYLVFLVLAALFARVIANTARLPINQARTLAFSLGTRNSFVVLPLALSLPAGWEIAAVVILLQSLIELFGMVFYLWWVPRSLFKTER